MSSSFSLFLSPPEPCAHLAEFLIQNGPHPFQSLQDCIITGPLGRASLRPTSAHYHYKCHVLNCLTPPHRLYACVSCATLTCHVHGGAHTDTDPGHVISVDIDRAELFCLRCLDIVYHPVFDSAVLSASASSTEFLLLRRPRSAAASSTASGTQGPSTATSSLSTPPHLQIWWQHAANLATYEQQDAHEFFISMLDGIHEKVAKDQTKPQIQGSGDCCVAHKVFSGILRSDVMCMACGFTSTTYDPCVDISLDLEPNQYAKGGSSKSRNSCNGEADPVNLGLHNRTSTLNGCLDRFTRPERLGPDQKFFCQHCQVRQESLKQMSIRKLPLVSCFHIKRFEHSSLQKTARKVDRYLQFPFSLDMAPYMSSSILRSRFGNRIFSSQVDNQEAPDELSSEFELFAVITHSGKLNAGHYVTYLRLSNKWYKCDDAWITQVSESIVRAAQGYMMFYVQKMFYYKASETPAPS